MSNNSVDTATTLRLEHNLLSTHSVEGVRRQMFHVVAHYSEGSFTC